MYKHILYVGTIFLMQYFEKQCLIFIHGQLIYEKLSSPTNMFLYQSQIRNLDQKKII